MCIEKWNSFTTSTDPVTPKSLHANSNIKVIGVITIKKEAIYMRFNQSGRGFFQTLKG